VGDDYPTEVRRVERMDRLRLGDVLGRLDLRRHTLARRAKEGIDLAKNLSREPYSARLQVELPPHAPWIDILRKNMRGDLI
jgi:hypothetical protein